jgi:hypothetical protein
VRVQLYPFSQTSIAAQSLASDRGFIVRIQIEEEGIYCSLVSRGAADGLQVGVVGPFPFAVRTVRRRNRRPAWESIRLLNPNHLRVSVATS